MKKVKKIYRLAAEIFSIWYKGQASTMGAAIAFYTIFAIAPLFMLVLALAGFFFGQEAAKHELFGQLSGLVGQKGGEAIQSVLAAVNKPRADTLATIIALITLFVGASGVFIQMQDSLNAIWNVRSKPGNTWHNFIKNRLLSFAMLLGIGFLLLVSLILSAALSAVEKYVNSIAAAREIIWQIGELGVSIGLATFLFAMIFKILPDVKISWKDVWFGAFITAILFTLGKFLLGSYLGRSTVASAYGAAGSLVIVLLWVYYSAQILLLGAAFTRVWAAKYGARIKPVRGAEFKTRP